MFTGLKVYAYIGLAIAIAGVFVYIRVLHSRVDHWRGQYDQVQATLNLERESHKQAMEQAEQQRTRDLNDAAATNNANVQHLQERIHANSDAADALRERLRVAERSRIRPLAPSASAPAQCRDYAADPTRLPDEDRSFLIGEAAAAERNGDLLEACRQDYKVALQACGVH